MVEFLKGALDFIRRHPAILYSLALVIVLPLILAASTFSAVTSFEGAIEDSWQSEGAAIAETLAVLLADDFSSPDSLQQKIQAVAAGGAQLENIRVIVKDGGDYRAIAAQSAVDVGKTINTDPSLDGESLIPYVWANGKEAATPVQEENGQKYWKIIKPLVSETSQETYGLVTVEIPLDKIERLIASIVLKSYLILALAIILTLFLIFQHTRLFAFVLLSDRLKEVDKMKDQFIRMATHELQSPVATIRGYIEELKDELAPVTNDAQKEYINRITLSSKNLADLIFDILEVSHLQQGRMDFDPELVSPAKIVGEIVGNVRLKAEAKGLKLSLEGADCLCFINVSENRFKQIVTNLIENSIKYTPKGEVKVSITAEKARKRCVVLVQDTGFGISAEGQARLFEQFYRVKTNENSGIPGTGLGLWMSKQMAQKMKGDILVESIEHVGSRFFIVFPLAEKK